MKSRPTGRDLTVWIRVLTVVTVLALVAAATMTWLWISEKGNADRVRADRASAAELDTAYADKAQTVLTHLMTIRQETLKEDVARIVSEIEGPFGDQFTPRKDSYEEVVTSTKVVADGVVSAKAVEKSSPSSADVIMAIDQTIGNPKAKDKQDRQYRVRVTVNRHDDGTMKVSGVNFIP